MKIAVVIYVEEEERRFLENKSKEGAKMSSYVRSLVQKEMKKEQKVEPDANTTS